MRMKKLEAACLLLSAFATAAFAAPFPANKDATGGLQAAINALNTAQLLNSANACSSDANCANDPLHADVASRPRCGYAGCTNPPYWDVSQVTNMYELFVHMTGNQMDVSRWNTSSVTNMARMFHRNFAFNGDISAWDVSKVTTMQSMFQGARVFNRPIGKWDVSSVWDFESTFVNVWEFNQPIGNWDTSGATRMSNMFAQSPKFNQDIREWDVSKVTTFAGMFNGATAWQARYVNCGFDSSPSACSEVSADKFVTSTAAVNGPPRAWIRVDGNCDAAFIVGGSEGSCTDALAPGSTCVPTCDGGGLSLVGTHHCVGWDSMSRATCVCDASSAIANGVPGPECTSTLAVGSSCAPTCDAGYVLSGSRSCEVVSSPAAALSDDAECVPSPCDASAAPANGGVGDCTNSLASGSTCQPTCDAGYTVSGTSSCSLGVVTSATCSPSPCDASAAPANGGVGDCTNSLASGSTCQPTCDAGYTVSGTSSCSFGEVTAAMCEPNPCDASAAPVNGGVGDCTNSLASGSTCQPTCDAGYTVSGTSSCSLGVVTSATCSPSPCDASAAPANGGVGDCTNSLASGSTCQPTCDAGYTVSGTSSCSFGVLTAAMCEPNPCTSSTDSSKDGSDGEFYCVNGGSVGGTTGSCTCTSCAKRYGGRNCHIGPCDMEQSCYDFNVRNGMTTPATCAWMAFEAPGCHAKCGACGDCDYELTTGDIPGWGASAAGGSTGNVASAQDCAKMCSENDKCLSYEYSRTSKICNRNTEADPTIKDNYRDYLFCSNKAASEA